MPERRLSRTRRLTRAAFRKVHADEPSIVGMTRREKGPTAAERQRTAIALSKARDAGASIPVKGGNPGNDEDLHGLEHGMGEGSFEDRRLREKQLGRMHLAGKIPTGEFNRRVDRLNEMGMSRPFDVSDEMEKQKFEEAEEFAMDVPGTGTGLHSPVSLGKGRA